MKNSNTKAGQRKSKDFPLYVHRGSQRWSKKVLGRTVYFRKLSDDADGQLSLEQWLKEKDDLLAGREPSRGEGLTLADLCNRYLTHKQTLRDARELSPRTFLNYVSATDTIINILGKTRLVEKLGPDDFRKIRVELSKRLGPSALRNMMQRIRSVFKFGFDEGIIVRPIRFGQAFALPGMNVIRRDRQQKQTANGLKMLQAADIRSMIDAASQPLKAMILLGINAALGNSDLARLPINSIDLEAAVIDYPRHKTAIERRASLWPETVEAIREWLSVRPKPKSPKDSGLLFVTADGGRWVDVTKKGAPNDELGRSFNALLVEQQLKRPGLGFYCLRHTFRTVADACRDRAAVDFVMGHTDGTMRAAYVERIDDGRLRAVTDHVRAWLFGKQLTGAV